jgi:hypothetical protein
VAGAEAFRVTFRDLRAIVWLRWRLLKNSVSSGRKRDAIEQISRAMAFIVPVAIAALSIGTFVAVGVIGFLGGRAIGSGLLDPPIGLFVLRILLAIVFLLIIALAMTSPTQGASAHYTRLLLLPIHRRVLHLVEVVATLADPWIAIIACGLTTFSLGVAAGGRPMAALAALGGTAGLVAVLVCAASVASFLVAWLMRSRRRGELFTLLFVMAFSFASFVPAMLSRTFGSESRDEGTGRRSRSFNIREFDAALPAWTAFLPPELHAGIIRDGLARRPGRVAIGVSVLGAQAVALFLLSARVHRHMLGSLEGEGGRRRNAELRASALRLPFFTPAASAVAWAQFRGALRSVRGRLTILLPGPMLGILTIAFRGIPTERLAIAATEHGYLMLGAALVLTLYSIHAVSMNFFGSDRAGLTLQLLSPIRDRDLAWGKVAGLAMVVAMGAVVCLAVSLSVARSGPAPYWIATLLGGAATFMLLSPVALWFSALFPVVSDLSKTGAGGNPHPLPMIAGTICTALFAAPAAFIIMAAEFWFGNAFAAVPLMAAWLAVTIAIAVPLINLSARTIGYRRENLAMVAQGR